MTIAAQKMIISMIPLFNSLRRSKVCSQCKIKSWNQLQAKKITIRILKAILKSILKIAVSGKIKRKNWFYARK